MPGTDSRVLLRTAAWYRSSRYRSSWYRSTRSCLPNVGSGCLGNRLRALPAARSISVFRLERLEHLLGWAGGTDTPPSSSPRCGLWMSFATAHRGKRCRRSLHEEIREHKTTHGRHESSPHSNNLPAPRSQGRDHWFHCCTSVHNSPLGPLGILGIYGVITAAAYRPLEGIESFLHPELHPIHSSVSYNLSDCWLKLDLRRERSHFVLRYGRSR